MIVRFSGAAIPFSAWHQTMVGPVFGFGLGGTGQLIPAVAAMTVDGLFERFPALKVVSVEAGCGYAGYLMDRLDEKWAHFKARSAIPRPPSDYIRRNVWFVAEPEERTIGAMLDLVGEDRICWGSDFPHVDSRMDAAQVIRASLESLAEPRRAVVLGDNAARVWT